MNDDVPAVWVTPGLAVIELAGADASAFLHGQLSHDIAGLAEGRSRLAAYCNPKGRVIGLLRVWRQPGGLAALVEADLAQPLAQRLRMFVLRAKVSVTVREDLAVGGVVGATAAAALAGTGLTLPLAPDGVEFADGGTLLAWPGPVPRVAVVGAPDAVRALGARVALASGTHAAWALADIRAGMAHVVTRTREAFLPHHLNLDLVDGLSFQKGCYPGQEIVARMHYRGRPTRRMQRFVAHSQHPLEPGEALHAGDRSAPAGEVVCAAPTRAGIELLAVVQLGALGATLRAPTAHGPVALEPLPLPYAVPELSAA
jgi:tRNA-modifying protein YgfZ